MGFPTTLAGIPAGLKIEPVGFRSRRCQVLRRVCGTYCREVRVDMLSCSPCLAPLFCHELCLLTLFAIELGRQIGQFIIHR